LFSQNKTNFRQPKEVIDEREMASPHLDETRNEVTTENKIDDEIEDPDSL